MQLGIMIKEHRRGYGFSLKIHFTGQVTTVTGICPSTTWEHTDYFTELKMASEGTSQN